MKNKHIPVLSREVFDNLNKIDTGVNVDLTLGSGGHAAHMVELNNSMILFDLDPNSWDLFKLRLSNQGINYRSVTEIEIITADGKQIDFYNQNFIKVLSDFDFQSRKVVNLVADLGPSQNQINSKKSGLSYKVNSYLDMRLSPELGVTAADLLNFLSIKQLSKLFSYGDISANHKFIDSIIEMRNSQKIETTFQLNELISKFTDIKKSQVYQALRIAVNLEYDNLSNIIGNLHKILHKNGVAQIITFHSGEERLLVKTVKETAGLEIKKIIKPGKEELKVNKRSRSAKLYILMLAKT